MPIPSKPIPTIKIRWDLANLPSPLPEFAKPFVMRTAGQEELEEALRVVEASYDLDPEWSGCDKYVEQIVIPGIKKTLAAGGECIFVLHGNRVIGASVYTSEAGDEGVHLISGPCVLTEYRSRGLGGSLLGATLEALRARGLTEAIGRTRPNGPSAKYLGTKFGGQTVAAPAPADPAPEDAVAA
ncbi:MAG: GNAT family N-acetyltransferase [Chthoniobacterales bacterium]